MSLADDFREEMAENKVLLQSWVSNDGFDDVFSEGALFDCMIVRKVRNVVNSDGQILVSKIQIHLDGVVTVTARDKVTYGTTVLKVLDIAVDYDIEPPFSVYSTTIYS